MIEATVSKNAAGTSVKLVIDGESGDRAKAVVDLALAKLKELKSEDY